MAFLEKIQKIRDNIIKYNPDITLEALLQLMLPDNFTKNPDNVYTYNGYVFNEVDNNYISEIMIPRFNCYIKKLFSHYHPEQEQEQRAGLKRKSRKSRKGKTNNKSKKGKINKKSRKSRKSRKGKTNNKSRKYK